MHWFGIAARNTSFGKFLFNYFLKNIGERENYPFNLFIKLNLQKTKKLVFSEKFVSFTMTKTATWIFM